MATDLATYRALVEEQPVCDDSWFLDALAKKRQGDAAAHSQILGSCLRIALTTAEEVAQERSLDVFDLLQEANSAVKRALKSFQGTCAAEFVPFVEETIRRRLEESFPQ